mmetsp:Transcript_47704/g.126494  ORF Transcript_47704/g.126494 Transcript_47704/m.126494 type:complete len:296 (-) Transcript_47704:189-1076(-)
MLWLASESRTNGGAGPSGALQGEGAGGGRARVHPRAVADGGVGALGHEILAQLRVLVPEAVVEAGVALIVDSVDVRPEPQHLLRHPFLALHARVVQAGVATGVALVHVGLVEYLLEQPELPVPRQPPHRRRASVRARAVVRHRHVVLLVVVLPAGPSLVAPPPALLRCRGRWLALGSQASRAGLVGGCGVLEPVLHAAGARLLRRIRCCLLVLANGLVLDLFPEPLDLFLAAAFLGFHLCLNLECLALQSISKGIFRSSLPRLFPLLPVPQLLLLPLSRRFFFPIQRLALQRELD